MQIICDRWHKDVSVHQTMYGTYRKFACIMFTNSTRGRFAFGIRCSGIRHGYMTTEVKSKKSIMITKEKQFVGIL